MTVTVPLQMVVAQWALLALLAALTAVMYRQLAALYLKQQHAHPRTGLRPGELAPEFTYELISEADPSPRAAAYRIGRGWTVLMFSDPLCTACERAGSALRQAEPALRERGVREILVVSGAPVEMVRAVPGYVSAVQEVAVVSPHVAHDDYRTDVAPYFYVVDPAGVVRAADTATDTAGIVQLVLKALAREEAIGQISAPAV